MASNDLKQAVAREITEGHSISEIARRHGYTYRGMWGLSRTPEVQCLVARERERLNHPGIPGGSIP